MRVVIGQGSCGIATGAKKTAAEFEKQIAEKNISNVTLGVTGCVGTCYLEPIVDVYDDDGKMTRYVKVQPDKVEKIVEESSECNHKVWQTITRSHRRRRAVCRQTAESRIEKLR